MFCVTVLIIEHCIDFYMQSFVADTGSLCVVLTAKCSAVQKYLFARFYAYGVCFPKIGLLNIFISSSAEVVWRNDVWSWLSLT